MEKERIHPPSFAAESRYYAEILGLGDRHHVYSHGKGIYVFNGDYRCLQPLYRWLGLSNSLDADSSLRVVKDAIRDHGTPLIIKSDQGS